MSENRFVAGSWVPFTICDANSYDYCILYSSWANKTGVAPACSPSTQVLATVVQPRSPLAMPRGWNPKWREFVHRSTSTGSANNIPILEKVMQDIWFGKSNGGIIRNISWWQEFRFELITVTFLGERFWYGSFIWEMWFEPVWLLQYEYSSTSTCSCVYTDRGLRVLWGSGVPQNKVPAICCWLLVIVNSKEGVEQISYWFSSQRYDLPCKDRRYYDMTCVPSSPCDMRLNSIKYSTCTLGNIYYSSHPCSLCLHLRDMYSSTTYQYNSTSTVAHRSAPIWDLALLHSECK